MKRYIWAILTSVFVLGLALWFGIAAVKQNERAHNDSAKKPQAPPVKTMTLYGSRISGRRGGLPFWQFDSERVEQGLNGGPTTFYRLRDGVIFRDGQPYISFTADKAQYDSSIEEIRLVGHLVAAFPEGTLITNEAVWYVRSERLVVETPVEVDGKDFKLSAGAMEVDLASETARFFKGVVLTRGGQTTAYTESMTHSLKDGVFEVPGPFSLEVEIDDEEE